MTGAVAACPAAAVDRSAGVDRRAMAALSAGHLFTDEGVRERA